MTSSKFFVTSLPIFYQTFSKRLFYFFSQAGENNDPLNSFVVFLVIVMLQHLILSQHLQIQHGKPLSSIKTRFSTLDDEKEPATQCSTMGNRASGIEWFSCSVRHAKTSEICFDKKGCWIRFFWQDALRIIL